MSTNVGTTTSPTQHQDYPLDEDVAEKQGADDGSPAASRSATQAPQARAASTGAPATGVRTARPVSSPRAATHGSGVASDASGSPGNGAPTGKDASKAQDTPKAQDAPEVSNDPAAKDAMLDEALNTDSPELDKSFLPGATAREFTMLEEKYDTRDGTAHASVVKNLDMAKKMARSLDRAMTGYPPR